ncbi:stretch-activated Ca2+-permeable channel component-domain-containing protein [Catenaria anguillulae PL171]|uniref:Stretch-activated Ca2+-permeable channel component-domain-containing protein n=1 Tax=Catenaria anguillulae PL171 TaxID=765915 RepID=A0A1Y2HR10_9FUNG|nr:stretch-activated Ca2+-permeable channel component-domain-containing protein [Catenaria anguillulae PL171]
MHRSTSRTHTAAALSVSACCLLALVFTCPSTHAQSPSPTVPSSTSTSTTTSSATSTSASAPFALPTGSLAQLDRQGRAAHCVRVPVSAVPFCQEVAADRWIALPQPLAATGALAQAAMLSMDTFARTAVANWTAVLDGLDCRTSDDERRYSVFRTCDDCAHAYRYWMCRNLFAECVPSSHLIKAGAASLPGVNRTEPVGSFRVTALGYLASAAGVNATLTIPGRLDKPLESQAAVLKIDGPPLKLAQPVSREAIEAAKAALKDVVKEDTSVDMYTTDPPCISICHHVIQSCPSAFQFACPRDHHEAWREAAAELVPSQRKDPSVDYPDYNPLC